MQASNQCASILQMGSYSQKMLLPYACTISGEVCDLICDLFDFVIKVLAGNQVGDVIIIIVLLVLSTLCLLHRLVALGKLSEGGQGVGTELVEDTRNKFGEFLILTVAVDSKSVSWNSRMNYTRV